MSRWTSVEGKDYSNGTWIGTHEFSRDPWGGPNNANIDEVCRVACDSKDDCTGYVRMKNSKDECYIGGSGSQQIPDPSNSRLVFMRDGPRPSRNALYLTKPPQVNPDSFHVNGMHHCTNDRWPGNGLFEIDAVKNSRWCLEDLPRPSRCPPELGKPVLANWGKTPGGGGAPDHSGSWDEHPSGGFARNNLEVRCRYDDSIPESIKFDENKANKYFDAETKILMRYHHCKTSENINSQNCRNWFQSADAKSKGYSFDNEMLKLCQDDSKWYEKSACRTALNSVIKLGTSQNKQSAVAKVNAYCQTPEGASQPDGICSCANVVRLGTACLQDANKQLPGCRELAATLGDLPPGAQVAFSDKFCASESCVTQALNDYALLPDFTPGKQCPNIQQCVQDFRNAKFKSSEVSASCNNVLNISGGDITPPPGPAPPGPAPPGPAPPGPAPPGPAISELTKRVLIVGGIFFILCFCLFILLRLL